ncbi:ADP-ribose pyrophosphatase [Gottschalkia purinilytica]|uniref:8-oxo-dGTP diphosphatase n=1 Tax=Gottschalkia purinilytica TaxID=1503 RepID=A0A0L0WAG2_GOTPU|nr:(deoxy)nucleoside triphosphate pyrophosphohydrolase [Gottschalkia purinilytica]KNF08310.1 ADP-ribose pyrophosphatase [Gottschalkia purinilytica]
MIDVVAGILIDNNKVLIAKRKEGKSMAGYWEFPGGKVESEEKPEDSLIRELREEMNIKIDIDKKFGESIYDYGNIEIKLIAFLGKIIEGNITLKDHDEYRWVDYKDLDKFTFSPADISFVKKLCIKGL